jgi:hypothetical protein
MMIKGAALAVAVMFSVLVAAPAPAFAGPNDNKNGAVIGVGGVDPNNAGCPPGYFCLYTGGNGNGVEFKLYECRTYALNNWNGIGSYTNNNTGGSPAQFLDEAST